MSENRILLDLAAFLDSAPARALAAEHGPAVREIVRRWLEVCYLDLASAPHLVDGEAAREGIGVHLAARIPPRWEHAKALPAVLAAFIEHLDAYQVVPHAYELRRAVDECAPALVAAVEAGGNAARAVRRPSRPLVHRAERLGRNDPCWCGSGKKFKKCHGR